MAILFLVLLWGQLFYALHPNWMDQSYYDYGWLLPPLIIYFAINRWRELPSPGAPPDTSPRWLWILITLLIVGLIPIRFLEHVDSYWRLPLWLHGLFVLGITHFGIALLVGKRQSIHLIPVTSLILLAIPFPGRIEDPFVSGLTTLVLDFTSNILPLAGYPVAQAGSSFVVNGELLDVSEGCSGIRSFQSCITAAIVLGELQRFSLLKRGFFLLAGIGIGIFINSLRVFTLIRITHEEGRAAMDAAHDRVGLWAAIITYFLIGLISWLLDRFSPQGRLRSSNVRKAKSTI